MTGPKDLSHLYSLETISRSKSRLSECFKHVGDPNIVFLGGGLPMASYFPWLKMSIESPLPPFANGISSSETNDPSTIMKYDLLKNSGEPNDIPMKRALQYGSSECFSACLNFFKEHTSLFHQVPYSDWDVTISAGSTQAIDSVLRTFINRGDSIMVEQYSFPASIHAMKTMGAELTAIPLDEDGIIPEKMEEILNNWDPSKAKPKLLYVIPTGQNPTGSNLPLERKKKIYALASKHDFIIVEDDPYYFLQMDECSENIDVESLSRDAFMKSLVKSFASLDFEGRVIRLESFSKILAPGTRIGFIIAQTNISQQLAAYNESSILNVSGFSATIVNSLLQRWGQNGYIDWLIGLRKEYTIKRNSASNSIKSCFSNSNQVFSPPTAGMFFTLKFDASKHPKFSKSFGKLEVENDIYVAALEEGTLMIPGSFFSVIDPKNDTSNGIFFRGTYAAVDLEMLDIGLRRFAGAVGKILEN
ncbi:hypothetical protein CANARDRAFT_28605 [[Candida] arabinofermentans NRRL YB-2248]|uniref:Aminotransferase class I/classII large domain-containing protein n=1 Tax=[Candida] arabinofermentans NRRL YB-2248 TaxID=983967 RepID=A0A1E4T0P7_9ASCO|nr:hypothetical protein CANARDRAFT_28605 [[Candida] arabinofermentans NRRL YB-2248]